MTILLAIVSNFVGFYNGMYTVLYNTQLNIAEKGFDIAGIDAYKDLVINNWKMWGQNILTITNEVAIFLVMAMIIILIIHFYQWRRNREFALLKGYNCLIKDVVYELKEELKNEIQNNQ